jgi:Spy/CpxP family protein refolding chaperone
MMKSLRYALLIVAAFAAAPLSAQTKPAAAAPADNMQILRDKLKADKKLLVAANVQLTEAEAKKFWPVYDAYQRAVDVANRDRVVAIEGLIGYDKPLSDPYAKNLAKELVVADEAEVKARRTLYNKVMKALPPKKAARYLQLESKVRAVQAYDIAVGIPLVK